MSIVSWLAFGALEGLLAHRFLPSHAPGGALGAVAGGTAGAFLGGAIFRLSAREARFEIRPGQPAHRGGGRGAAARRRAKGGLHGAAGPMIRVLVVDDHPAVRAGLVGLLRGEPGLVPVSTAATAAEAVAATRRWTPDIVLADYGLPDQDGGGPHLAAQTTC